MGERGYSDGTGRWKKIGGIGSPGDEAGDEAGDMGGFWVPRLRCWI